MQKETGLDAGVPVCPAFDETTPALEDAVRAILAKGAAGTALEEIRTEIEAEFDARDIALKGPIQMSEDFQWIMFVLVNHNGSEEGGSIRM